MDSPFFKKIILLWLLAPESKPPSMLHQVIFQKLLGEIDYGARGDFSGAGCV